MKEHEQGKHQKCSLKPPSFETLGPLHLFETAFRVGQNPDIGPKRGYNMGEHTTFVEQNVIHNSGTPKSNIMINCSYMWNHRT